MFKEELNKFETLKGMNTIVKNLNNEDAYFKWIEIVPDEAMDDGIADVVADDELFRDAVHLFKELMCDYLEDGFDIGGVLY